MYTTTRKIAIVCLAVVFSVLVYGCGGGDSKRASTEPPTDSPDGTDVVITPTVDMSMVTAGLIIPAGTFTILPGESRDQYDATFTCPIEGLSCEVTVADDGTATSVGGLATAMNSVPGNDKLEVENPVDTGMVTTGLTIEAGMYTIQPGGNMDAGDATFTCSAGGVPCVVTVADDGTATSAGGTAMAMNSVPGNDKLEVENPVDTGDVTVGLTIKPGMYTIQPGGSMDFGDATFTCDPGGVPCVVTVADGGTATSAGGMATAMNSAAGNDKLEVENPVDTSTVALGLTIKPGTYLIQPGAEMDLFDATFTCDPGGVPCVVTVELTADGTYTVESAGAMATAKNSAAGNAKLVAPNDVDMSMVTAGLTAITADTYTIPPGGSMDAGDVIFSCRAGGVPCVVIVADNGTITSAGGKATAMNSPTGYAKLNVVNVVDVTNLATGYDTITPGTYIIPPDDDMDVGDANFACPEGGVPCVVTVKVEVGVDEDDNPTAVNTVTSLGGVATGGNTELVMSTRAAIALTTTGAGLDMQATDRSTVASAGVARKTDGSIATIELTPGSGDADTVEYTAAEAVDVGHEISGWDGQTMKRSDADDLPTPQEATFYTNIAPAKPQKLIIAEDGTLPTEQFVLDAGQGNIASLIEAGRFTGAYGRVRGTFTCEADTCTLATPTSVVGGERILGDLSGWAFASDGYVESEATQDADYLYFGYWLESPAPDAEDPAYMFATYYGGPTGTDGTNTNVFTMASELTTDNMVDEPLTATYEGGSGRYVCDQEDSHQKPSSGFEKSRLLWPFHRESQANGEFWYS